MAIDWKVIRTPLEAHGARTADMYADLQQRFVQRLNQRRAPVSLHDAADGAVVIIDGQTAMVVCGECGGRACASREWDIARCFDCGAIYRALDWGPDFEEVCAALLEQPAEKRIWTPMLDETGQVVSRATADDIRVTTAVLHREIEQQVVQAIEAQAAVLADVQAQAKDARKGDPVLAAIDAAVDAVLKPIDIDPVKGGGGKGGKFNTGGAADVHVPVLDKVAIDVL